MNIEQRAAALLESCKKTAEEILRAGKEHAPLAICIDDDGYAQGGIIPTHTRELTRAFNATVVETFPIVCFVQEAWYTSVTVEEFEKGASDVPPSQHPDRKESLMITLFVEGRRQLTTMLNFERKDGKTTSDWKWIEDSGPECKEFRTPAGSVFPNKE